MPKTKVYFIVGDGVGYFPNGDLNGALFTAEQYKDDKTLAVLTPVDEKLKEKYGKLSRLCRWEWLHIHKEIQGGNKK